MNKKTETLLIDGTALAITFIVVVALVNYGALWLLDWLGYPLNGV